MQQRGKGFFPQKHQWLMFTTSSGKKTFASLSQASRKKVTSLYSGLNINILGFASRQTTSFVCTSQIFLCIIVHLKVVCVMLLQSVTPAAYWGSCSDAKLPLYTLERVMEGLVAGGLTLQDFAFTSNGSLLVVEQ